MATYKDYAVKKVKKSGWGSIGPYGTDLNSYSSFTVRKRDWSPVGSYKDHALKKTSKQPPAPYRKVASVQNTDPATYMLVIEPVNIHAIEYQYIFPISPSQLQASHNFYNTYYDVPSKDSSGVNRIIDEYGEAPPIFTVAGTTGWNAQGSSGYKTGGLQAFRDLEAFLERYNSLNREAQQSGFPGYRLAFMDFWYHSYWYVTPTGEAKRIHDQARPIIVTYEMTFTAYQRVDASDNSTPPLWSETFDVGNVKQLPSTISSVISKIGGTT